jgi:hypothetical protein
MRDEGRAAPTAAPAMFVPPVLVRTPRAPFVPSCARSYSPPSPRARSYPPALVRTPCARLDAPHSPRARSNPPALVHTLLRSFVLPALPLRSFVPPAFPSYLVAAVAAAPAGAGGSDGAGAVAAVALPLGCVPVCAGSRYPVAFNWAYVALARARLGSFGLICLYQIQD